MSKFIVPEFYRLQSLWKFILDLYKNNNSIFIKNRKIHSIYGCFPNMIWNGGRVSIEDQDCTENDIINTFEFYSKYDVSIALTVSNLCLTEKHLNDAYCNMIFKIANKYNTYAIVSLDIIENYIRNTYPNIKITKSIQSATSDNPVDTSNKYDLAVMSIDKNHDFEYLKTLKNPENIEILVSQDCIPNCPIRIKHLTHTSQLQLEHRKDETPFCIYEHNNKFNSTRILTDDLYKYEELGFKHFKLTDRDVDNFDILKETYQNVCDYLIKPQYREEIFEIISQLPVKFMYDK